MMHIKYIFIYVLSFDRAKERYQRKPAGCNKTAKNLLVTASPDKLLAALVEQYLRSSLSYGFINAVFCDAGEKGKSYG